MSGTMSSGELDDPGMESICDFISKQNSTDASVNLLWSQWQTICTDFGLDINMRFKMDEWFKQCFEARSRVRGLSSSGSGDAVSETDKLYQQFFTCINDLIRVNGVLERLQLAAFRQQIENTYGQRHSDWVDVAIRCVEREHELLATHRQTHEQVVYEVVVEEDHEEVAIDIIGNDIENLKRLLPRLSGALECLEESGNMLTDHCAQKDQAQEDLSRVVYVFSTSNQQSKGAGKIQHFQSELQKFTSQTLPLTEQFNTRHQAVVQIFHQAYEAVKKLVAELKERIQTWKRQLQLNFAELSATPELDYIDKWCAITGDALHDILHKHLSSWENVLTNIPLEIANNNSACQEQLGVYQSAFQKLLRDFIQCTFLVTSQNSKEAKNSSDNKGYIVKIIKSGSSQKQKFPVFSVRILAAASFNKSSEITAYFVSEHDLNECYHDDALDLEKLKKKWRNLEKSTLKLTQEHGKNLECCFQNLQLSKFDRSKEDKQIQVHEDKYRVIFVTEIEAFQLWTLSLPMMVITGSIQEASCLASVMWQCFFSQNVFSLPQPDMSEEMPWSQVAEMLQYKILRLSPHRLTAENLNHLKYRLLGDEQGTDDPTVSLSKFCWTLMENMDVSFWQWFLGIYNMLERYLCKYWQDGLIMGFVKKEDAMKMLQTGDVKPGTFILRFSDNHLTKSQGLRTVYGRLTSCVVVLKTCKGSKRDGPGEVRQVKVVESVDVADFKKLENNSLANILRETWIKSRDGSNQIKMYQYLYPTGESREQLFDQLCNYESERSLDGYRHTRDAYVAVLDQQLAKLSIKKSSSSSEMGTSSVKKARRRTDAGYSRESSISSQSDFLSEMSTPQDSPLYHAQSPSSVQSPYSALPSPSHTQGKCTTPSTSYPVTSQLLAQKSLDQGLSQTPTQQQALSFLPSSVSGELPDLSKGHASQNVCGATSSMFVDTSTHVMASHAHLLQQPPNQSQTVSATSQSQHIFVENLRNQQALGQIGVPHSNESITLGNLHQAVDNFLMANLTPDQYKQVVRWVGENQCISQNAGTIWLCGVDAFVDQAVGGTRAFPQMTDMSQKTGDMSSGHEQNTDMSVVSTSSGGLSDILCDIGIDSGEMSMLAGLGGTQSDNSSGS